MKRLRWFNTTWNLAFIQISECGVQGPAAYDAILIILRPAMRGHYQVLDTGFALGNRITAEEAAVPLKEEKTFELFHQAP
ncbi:MAG: hypothetical protein U1F77_01720 [Kiritimatiellia bacterium]